MTEIVERLLTEHLDTWTAAVETKSAAGRGSSKKLKLVGIAKLRELILELAVRGQLVPQDESDEPASVLLERIAAERERLIKEKKIKKQKLLPAVTDDEVSVELPKGWQWTRLGNIAEIGPRNILGDKTEVSFVPMPLISTSYDGRHGQEVRTWSEIKKAYTHFADGDIGLAKITPCFENSKAAVFSGLKNGYGAGTTELHIARPLGNFYNSLYILLYLKAPQFLVVGQTKMTGSAGQKRVPREFFVSNPLPLPPWSEQNRIVAKVDELMALCDALEQEQESSIAAHGLLVENLLAALTNAAGQGEFKEAWARVAAHFDTLFTTEQSFEQLKQTILQLAVMGKLVEQNPADEPAGVLLERIATERERLVKEKKIKKPKVLPEVSEGEKPFELSVGWTWARFGDLHTEAYTGLDRGKSSQSADFKYAYLKMNNIRNSGGLDFSGLTRVEASEVEVSRYTLKLGDFLFNTRNSRELVGKTGVFQGFDDPVLFNNNILKAKLFELDAKYLDIWFRSISGKKALEEKKSNTTNVCAIYQGKLFELLCAIPPKDEQKYIVAKVDELFAICDRLRVTFRKAQSTQLQVADTLTGSVS